MRCIHANLILFIAVLSIVLAACDQEDIPLYQPEAAVKTKTVCFLFQDKADATPNIAIYINNTLLQNNGATRGLLNFYIPDSLQNRTFTVSLAEYDGSSAPKTLTVDGLLYETLLFPDEVANLTSVLMTRDDDMSPVKLIKLGISATEAAPAPGYFKIKFYNVTTDTMSIETRDGTLVAGYEALKGFEDKAYAELPFGQYRFTVRRGNKSKVAYANDPPFFSGAAGKMYTVLLSQEVQQMAEVKDFGTPAQPLAHLGFLNLIPGQAKVSLEPVAGGYRTVAEDRPYAEYKDPEMVPAGKVTVKVGSLSGGNISAEHVLTPWENVVACLIEKDGKPALQFIHYPIYENADPTVFIRFLNFSPDAGTVSFGRRVDTTNPDYSEPPVAIIAPAFTSNLAFGQVVIPAQTEQTNNVYVNYDFSVVIHQVQAHKAVDNPLGLGDSIAHASMYMPFFYNRPDPQNYAGPWGQAGTYSVMLIGRTTAGVPEEERARLIVIHHSY